MPFLNNDDILLHIVFDFQPIVTHHLQLKGDSHIPSQCYHIANRYIHTPSFVGLIIKFLEVQFNKLLLSLSESQIVCIYYNSQIVLLPILIFSDKMHRITYIQIEQHRIYKVSSRHYRQSNVHCYNADQISNYNIQVWTAPVALL